jgi:hypothetical protein
LIFRVRGEIYDSYGDEYNVNDEFTADMSGRIVKKVFDGSEALIEETSVESGVSAIRKLFNVAVHNYDISFWDTDLCHEISCDPDIDLLPEYRYGDGFDFDDEFDEDGFDGDDPEQPESDAGDVPDDRIPSWSVGIEYIDGVEQNTKGYDFLPDPVIGLFDNFNGYFEENEPDSGFDE